MKTLTGATPESGKANEMLKDEVIHYRCELGIMGCFTENLRISIKVEKEHYEDAVRWLHILTYRVQYDNYRYVCTRHHLK